MAAHDPRVNKLVKFFGDLRGRRTNWDDHWRDVSKFVLPRKDDVFTQFNKTEGEQKGEAVFDASPRHYNELLASALQSMLTSPNSQWFELTTGDPDLDKLPAVRKYLQQLVRTIHQTLNNTNFNSEIHETYLDLGSFGTGVIRIEPDEDNVLRFHSRPIYEYWIAENNKGEVDTFYTRRELTIRQIIQEFGAKELSPDFLRQHAEDMEKKFEVIEGLMPRKDAKQKSLGPKGLPWASFSFMKENDTMLKESGFHEFPAMFPRWTKISGEMYGRSPSMKSLPDIKMINKMMADTLRSAQKITDPPLMLPDDGVFGRVNTMPGGLNYYRSGTQDRIFPLQTGGQPGVGLEIMADVRNRIKQAFFIDQLQLIEKDRMTATEVSQRTDEHLRLLSPILGRQHFELLQPMIVRIIGIMKRKNMLPDNPPEELLDINLQVFYSSQIAKAQRISEGINFQRFLEAMAPIAQVDPSVVDNLDADAALKFNATIYGVPEEVFRDTQEVKELRGQRAAEEERLRRQQDAAAQAEVINKAGPTLVQANQ